MLRDNSLEHNFARKAINLLSSPQELQEYKITASYQYYNKLQFASPNYENIEFRDRNIAIELTNTFVMY